MEVQGMSGCKLQHFTKILTFSNIGRMRTTSGRTAAYISHFRNTSTTLVDQWSQMYSVSGLDR